MEALAFSEISGGSKSGSLATFAASRRALWKFEARQTLVRSPPVLPQPEGFLASTDDTLRSGRGAAIAADDPAVGFDHWIRVATWGRNHESTKLMRRGGSAGRIVVTVVAAAAVVTVLSAANAPSRRVQVGTLTCSLSAGIGLSLAIIGDVLFAGGGRSTDLPDESLSGVCCAIIMG